MKQNIEKALEKAIANLDKLDIAAAEIISKQRTAKAEVARLTMIKYGKPYFDLTAKLDQKGIEYNDEEVRKAFDTSNFQYLHELSLRTNVDTFKDTLSGNVVAKSSTVADYVDELNDDIN